MTEVDVVVLGAAGQTGRPLVTALVQRGARVRAVVHRAARGGWEPGVREVAVDLANPRELTAVLRQARSAYYIPPVFSAHEEAFGANVIAAAVAAELPHLVYHSVLQADSPDMPHHWRKFQVERALRSSPLNWTILRPAMYAQTPLSFLNARRTTLSVGFNPDRDFTPIDLRDLAAAAAQVLLEEGHGGRSYDLAGSQRLTYRQMAEEMARAWQHPVRLRRVPGALVAVVAARRFGVSSVPLMRAMLTHYDRAGLTGDDADLRALLNRPSTPFAVTLQQAA